MRWKLLVVFLITAASLAWALWGLDLRAMGTALLAYRLESLALVMLVFSFTFVARTLRFGLLVDARVSFRALAAVMAVGFLAINVVPLRMGELVRPYLLRERHGVPFGTSMAAVVMERLLDLVGLLVLMALVGWTVELPPGGVVLGGVDLLTAGQRVAGMSVVVGLIGVIGLAVAGDRGVALLVRVAQATIPALAPPIEQLGGRFAAAFSALAANPFKAASSVALTVVVWAGTVLAVGVAMTGLDGLEPTVDRVLLNWTAIMTAMLLLPTPGFVGSLQLGCVGSLVLLGVDPEVAKVFSVVLHAELFGFTAALGMVFLAVEGWSLTHLVRASRATA